MDGSMPPVNERIELLFSVWREPGGTERSNEAVARAVSAAGLDLSAEALVAARAGSVVLQKDVLGAIAAEFGVDQSYLLSDEAVALHDQLVLLREVGTSGIKGIHLRGGDFHVDAVGMAELLRQLRERSSNN
ncbi:hypothetical protein [Rhodococcoides trifolii]|uniref:hypothetical protein n=1 Tax=Rhodococcoides trifolii TaxID=908250 RepID=UPI0016633FDF|nr:hypothetical protein [Rhodococcus trifolii]